MYWLKIARYLRLVLSVSSAALICAVQSHNKEIFTSKDSFSRQVGKYFKKAGWSALDGFMGTDGYRRRY